jgi:hypothetical protein
MKVPRAATVTLARHPATACSLRTIEVNASMAEPNVLKLNYVASGDVSRVRIPGISSPHRIDGLWQHTCFEAFIRAVGAVYYEFNFSPSGEWAAYSFRGYRDGGPFYDDGLSPEIVVRREADKIELDAVVRLDRLPALRRGSLLRLGLSAVIESSDGALSYWALKHPADKPDFHHPDSLALELALPDWSA